MREATAPCDILHAPHINPLTYLLTYLLRLRRTDEGLVLDFRLGIESLGLDIGVGQQDSYLLPRSRAHPRVDLLQRNNVQ